MFHVCICFTCVSGSWRSGLSNQQKKPLQAEQTMTKSFFLLFLRSWSCINRYVKYAYGSQSVSTTVDKFGVSPAPSNFVVHPCMFASVASSRNFDKFLEFCAKHFAEYPISRMEDGSVYICFGLVPGSIRLCVCDCSL